VVAFHQRVPAVSTPTATESLAGAGDGAAAAGGGGGGGCSAVALTHLTEGGRSELLLGACASQYQRERADGGGFWLGMGPPCLGAGTHCALIIGGGGGVCLRARSFAHARVCRAHENRIAGAARASEHSALRSLVQVSQHGCLLKRRGCVPPASVSGFGTHRDSISLVQTSRTSDAGSAAAESVEAVRTTINRESQSRPRAALAACRD
jgi:hypothetical protein